MVRWNQEKELEESLNMPNGDGWLCNCMPIITFLQCVHLNGLVRSALWSLWVPCTSLWISVPVRERRAGLLGQFRLVGVYMWDSCERSQQFLVPFSMPFRAGERERFTCTWPTATNHQDMGIANFKTNRGYCINFGVSVSAKLFWLTGTGWRQICCRQMARVTWQQLELG